MNHNLKHASTYISMHAYMHTYMHACLCMHFHDLREHKTFDICVCLITLDAREPCKFMCMHALKCGPSGILIHVYESQFEACMHIHLYVLTCMDVLLHAYIHTCIPVLMIAQKVSYVYV